MDTDKDYFFSHIIKTRTCWIWTGYNNGVGYGKFRIGPKLIYAHRYSYAIHNGKIPDGLYVLHKCDNPTCVNPKHLEVGTQQKNLKDAVIRRRAYTGERCHLSKILAKDVSFLRRTYLKFKIKQSKRLGISCQQIENILRIRSWR